MPDTTIDSAKYNTNVHDVEADLNTPRPIVAGGTGGTSPDTALTNLKAEKYAQVVTNWDSAPWMAGSFYAASTATGAAPVAGHAFAGIAYMANATDFVNEAIDLTDTTNPKYVRTQTAGVWGSWIVTSGSSVRYDIVQNLTEPQKVQARMNIYAAPFDAMAYSGLQVNGSFEVSQELGNAGIAFPAGAGRIHRGRLGCIQRHARQHQRFSEHWRPTRRVQFYEYISCGGARATNRRTGYLAFATY